jgi:hypothetical protein
MTKFLLNLIESVYGLIKKGGNERKSTTIMERNRVSEVKAPIKESSNQDKPWVYNYLVSSVKALTRLLPKVPFLSNPAASPEEPKKLKIPVEATSRVINKHNIYSIMKIDLAEPVTVASEHESDKYTKDVAETLAGVIKTKIQENPEFYEPNNRYTVSIQYEKDIDNKDNRQSTMDVKVVLGKAQTLKELTTTYITENLLNVLKRKTYYEGIRTIYTILVNKYKEKKE